MKSKIALIFCLIVLISCIASCQKATEITDGDTIDSSAIQSEASSQETSNDNSEADETPAIPEDAQYFQHIYYFPHHDGMVYSYTGLVELYACDDLNISNILKQQNDADKRDDRYYYVGIRLFDRNITDEDELTTKNETMIKQVGFIPTDEPYLNKDYVWDLYYSLENEPLSVQEAAWRNHLQNLVPNADLSQYDPITEQYYYSYYVDFAFDYTGYITLDGLKELKENYTGVQYVWLPAPDDRERYLTYIDWT